jgi:hypothetical protein
VGWSKQARCKAVREQVCGSAADRDVRRPRGLSAARSPVSIGLAL